MDNPAPIFENFLKTKGLKLTKPRQVILDVVFETHTHFNVDELYDIIKKDHQNVSLATIYRTMPLLVNSGLIKQSHRSQSKEHFEHIHGHADHLHLICSNCGNLIEEESKELENKLNTLAKKHNFVIEEFNINAKGKCFKCK